MIAGKHSVRKTIRYLASAVRSLRFCLRPDAVHYPSRIKGLQLGLSLFFPIVPQTYIAPFTTETPSISITIIIIVTMPFPQSHRRAFSYREIPSQAHTERRSFNSPRSQTLSHSHNASIEEEHFDPYYAWICEPQFLYHAQDFEATIHEKAVGQKSIREGNPAQPPMLRTTRSEGIRRTSSRQACADRFAAPVALKPTASKTVHFTDEKQQSKDEKRHSIWIRLLVVRFFILLSSRRSSNL